jgi:formate--tetrahydrofolate ligase
MTDIQIAQAVTPKPISLIASELGIAAGIVQPYGQYKAKIPHDYRGTGKNGAVVLVTAISPTPMGEGKTTTTVGLGDALRKIGQDAVICVREPSLGPVFGMKGGATGGGHAQVIPMEDINLHFTGDLHAITTANNLLAAMVDNHIHHGNALKIDPRRVTFRRAMDMNDRQLRNIMGGMGGKAHGTPREDGFNITAASEIMAVFCLSTGLQDLKENIARIVVGYSYEGTPVTAGQLQAEGAMATLLADALNPNLVQTLEGTPAIVHGGPFANIAHGCNTIVATNLARRLGDIVVTEAGFGADLGAEKFLNIKARRMRLAPSCVVVVATVRALAHHGGGVLCMENLARHVENMRGFGLPVVVAINRFPTDTPDQLDEIRKFCGTIGVPCALSEVHGRGGAGGTELAQAVLDNMSANSTVNYTYETGLPLRKKITAVATKIYRADNVIFSDAAKNTLRTLEKQGYGSLPICIAKTQYSFSDNAKLTGAPTGFTITIREVRLSAGAGFVVALAGDIMTMPGLPKAPAAESIDITNDGIISGLF